MAAAAANTDTASVPEDRWKKLASPRRKKEKDVFKFLKENDTNYTVRRQQMQINIMLEKNQQVKKVLLSCYLGVTYWTTYITGYNI